MKKIKTFIPAVCFLLLMTLTSYAALTAGSQAKTATESSGQIYLYGEAHGIDAILEKELSLWKEHYEKDGMRHLFVELPYYTAEYLNLWMKADDDTILDAVYDDWSGAAVHIPSVKKFYASIKKQTPETIFHGTDVGHQHASTGERYLNYLREHNLEDSQQYRLTRENIEQGKSFYEHADNGYRENKMVENFRREFEQLNGESIMGIYGGAHTGFEEMKQPGTICNMATQLKRFYGENVHSEDLTWIKDDIAPTRVDTMRVNGRDYQASYFGKQDLSNLTNQFVSREFWRLEHAYDDFKDKVKSGDALPYSNYLMPVDVGQVFVIDYTKPDGSTVRLYYRSDGNMWNGMLTTEGVLPGD